MNQQTPPAGANSGPDGFLAGDGELARAMRTLDWSSTPLGEPHSWPQALRGAIRLILNSGHPMYIWWGPQFACLYNDAYLRSICPDRHPDALGRPAREVWSEIWPIIGAEVEQVMNGGGATWNENAPVPVIRNGRREEAFWTYSYSPIDDETTANGVGGVLVICTDTTAVVHAGRRIEEAAGKLTGGLAHDFNNLLAGISGSIEVIGKLLARGRAHDAERFIEAAQSSTRRAVALTQRLLAFSRRQTLDPHFGAVEPTDPIDPGKSVEAGAGETVLVIDDEPAVRILMCEVLAEDGYLALEAADGPAALAILGSDARIDLLITDISLPGGMNGRQIADAARVTRPDLKVLFITGYTEKSVVGDGHLERGMAVLTKPFGMTTLGGKIRELIAR